MKTQEYEYEALIFCDDELVAQVESQSCADTLSGGRLYLLQYAEEGEVEMRIYKKELIYTEKMS